jgi:hypothetical protein
MGPGRAGRSVRACAHLSLTPDEPPCSRESGPFGSSTEEDVDLTLLTHSDEPRTVATNRHVRTSSRRAKRQVGTAGRRSEFPTLFAGPSRPSSRGEHRRLRPRGQRRVAVSRETSPATGWKKPSPRRAYPPSLWRRGSRIRAKEDARPGAGTSSAVDTSPLTLTHARASDGCGRRPPGPGVPASPGQRAIPLAAKGFSGTGAATGSVPISRVTQMSRERDPAGPRPRVLRIHVKRQLPSEPCGRSELSSRPPDRSYLPDNPRAPPTSQSPLGGEAMFHVKQRLVGGVRPQRPVSAPARLLVPSRQLALTTSAVPSLPPPWRN